MGISLTKDSIQAKYHNMFLLTSSGHVTWTMKHWLNIHTETEYIENLNKPMKIYRLTLLLDIMSWRVTKSQLLLNNSIQRFLNTPLSSFPPCVFIFIQVGWLSDCRRHFLGKKACFYFSGHRKQYLYSLYYTETLT